MKKYKMSITLESEALISSGEGFGAIIDTDVIFDENGLPYIPAKRIKGCLRDSALEVLRMFSLSNIGYFMSAELNNNKETNNYKIITEIFGTPGSDTEAKVYFSNFFISDYREAKEWFEYLCHGKKEYADIISKDSIIETFTSIRRQTEINENGTAKEYSLRTSRVLRKSLLFSGLIEIGIEDPLVEELLGLACSNLRRIGTKRSRGLGEVTCKLFGPGTMPDNDTEIKTETIIKKIEGRCK